MRWLFNFDQLLHTTLPLYRIGVHSILAVLILLLSQATDAQDRHYIDSLKSVVATATEDSAVFEAYLNWGERIYRFNPDTALLLFIEAYKLSERNINVSDELIRRRYLRLSGQAVNNIGAIYNSKGDIDKALKYLHRSLEINEDLGDKLGMGTALNNLAFVYRHQGEVAKSLGLYHRSLAIRKELDHKLGIASCLNNIALVFESQGNIEKAIDYYAQSLVLRESEGDSAAIAQSLNNLGTVYSGQDDIEKALEYFLKALAIRERQGKSSGTAISLNNVGYIHQSEGDFDLALEYYLKAMKMREDLGDKEGMANSYNNIGAVYSMQKQYDQAMRYHSDALALREEIGNKEGIAGSLENLGIVALETGDLSSAQDYGERSIVLAQKLGIPSVIQSAAHLLTLVHKQKGNFKKALDNYELHIQMRDSTNNEKTQKATIRQQTKYEFEKAQLVKEQEVKETARFQEEATSRRDNLQYSVILISILILFGGILFLRVINVSERMAEGIIFFSFLILFEFLLVLADPYIEGWSGGAPGIKLLFNAGIAAFIFPLHSFFETKLKGRLVK